MKLFASLLVITFSVQVQAIDEILLDYKDWSAHKVEAHKVSEKGACVAATTEEASNTHLEVYLEASEAGGYVQPVVQIVTTDLAPALGVIASVDGIKMPMTISLAETKEIEVEELEEGSSIPVIKTIEQQVFLGKFKEKDEMIRLLRARLEVTATFYDASGEVGEAAFSLRGSSRTIGTMLEACLE